MSGHEQPAQVDVGILSVIAPELDAAFTVLGIDRLHDRTKEASGTIYWYGSTFSKIVNRHYSFVLGCIGRAGNPESGAAAAEMIAKGCGSFGAAGYEAGCAVGLEMGAVVG
ncbi:MAG: hypothetical protein K1Y02_20060 [Candidatus Hydrogenedentes bacterium]|nr:hypothetical protein [Candidatus Hydrogenedentota bacterium]